MPSAFQVCQCSPGDAMPDDIRFFRPLDGEILIASGFYPWRSGFGTVLPAYIGSESRISWMDSVAPQITSSDAP